MTLFIFLLIVIISIILNYAFQIRYRRINCNKKNARGNCIHAVGFSGRLYLGLWILMVFLCGCNVFNFSVNNGKAKFAIPFDLPGTQNNSLLNKIGLVYVGMDKSELYEIFTPVQQNYYSQKGKGNKEWITFSDKESVSSMPEVTFYLMDGKVKEWELKGK